MPPILDPELQCPLLHHGLVHLYPPEISTVYAACVELRDTIEGDRAWLDGNCQHILPHSYGDVPSVDEGGNQTWYRDGQLHRGGDLPAVIQEDGTQLWYQDGEQHRDGDLPAEIWVSGEQRWCKYGNRHRDGDLPAEIWKDGSQFWYKDGRLQRDWDLPAMIDTDGGQHWYKRGEAAPRRRPSGHNLGIR